MAKLLTSPKILSDAVSSGIKFLETGQYDKSKKYLEYSYNNSDVYASDQFVLYALAITYFNLAEYEKANDFIKRLQSIGDVNVQILDTVKQMIEDLKVVNNKSENSMEIDLEIIDKIKRFLPFNKEEFEKFLSKTEDPFYSYILNQDENDRKAFDSRKEQALESMTAFLNVVENITSNDDIDYEDIYYNYSISINNMHSLFMIAAQDSGVLRSLLVDENVAWCFRNELVFDAQFFSKLGYFSKRPVTYLDENLEKQKFSLAKSEDIGPKMKEVIQKVDTIFGNEYFDLGRIIKRLAFKYMLMNYINLDTISVDGLLNKIYSYIYLEEELTKEIKDFVELQLKDQDIDNNYLEIKKIADALKNFML